MDPPCGGVSPANSLEAAGAESFPTPTALPGPPFLVSDQGSQGCWEDPVGLRNGSPSRPQLGHRLLRALRPVPLPLLAIDKIGTIVTFLGCYKAIYKSV